MVYLFLMIFISYRKSNFAKLNTNALFNAVDKDNNGEIEFDEWLAFWKAVKKAGYKEKEILREVIINYTFFIDIRLNRWKMETHGLDFIKYQRILIE